MHQHNFLLRSLAFLILLGVHSAWDTQMASAQLIIAHRGASAEAPENTLAAFKLAWKKGADGIEGDFYLSRDGQIVTIHDATTKRTANKNLVVADSTLAQLRKLDFGSWKSKEYAGERIPTLSEVLAIVPPGKKIFIEIKCGPEIVPELKNVLSTSKLNPSQTIVIAFDKKVIVAVKDQIPQIKAYWLTGFKRSKLTGKWHPTIATLMKTLKAIGADGLDTQNNMAIVNADFVKTLRAAELEFHVWTIDKPSEARYFQRLGADSLTTNHAKEIRQSLVRP